MMIPYPCQQVFRRTCIPLSLILCLLNLPACDEQQAASPPPAPPPSPVRVAPVLQREVKRTVTLVGTVEPWKRSVVASEVEGLVQAFTAEEGMKVKRGDLLARLRTRTLRIRLDSAVAIYRESGARYERAKRNLKRVRALFKRELVTQKDFDDAVAEEAALKERLSQLDAEIRQVRDSLNKSTVVAPFDGWITQEFTEIGQWVEEGGPVVEMVDLSHVQVEVPLPERYVSHIQIHDPVTATFDGLPAFEAQGRVFSLVAQADRTARTFPVKVEIPNPALAIKSGMVSRVTLRIDRPHQGLVVPKDALVLRGGKAFVFRVNEGTVVDQIPVTAILHVEDLVEIEGPVQAGMDVVVEGNERLFPGQSVRILESPGEAPGNTP
ncbi:MAG: efflux RND transporter periplasmic adaptor subunit [Nitrospira sp.]|nr:efflux RND transporter periplasmic adaptor subunit [Nitrospira sp.]